ncbi:MAG: nuclear transport factor 2 family protein [Acidimicrobiia bacterium]|nr:nuclear transport factor 2 family protein [Acidimicrobiia bacterium]MDH5519557.1 nuclear transport factor 2 family protein [Acidimicrobiia bacterium]
MAEILEPIAELTEALAARDVERAMKLYAADAQVVRYEGVAKGTDEIRAFLIGFLSGYERFELISVDQVQRSDDMVVFDSSSETGAGVLQMINVLQLDDDGLITRHVPLIRGYWGKT